MTLVSDPRFLPGIAVTFVGVCFTAAYARDIYFAWRSKTWPKTTGRVLVSDIDFSGGGRYRMDSPLVGYEYEVRGVKYKSNRIDYAGRGSGWSARTFIRRFPEGKEIEVRYDPSEPARAILLPGITVGNVFRLICGLLIIWFGVVAF